MRRDVAILLTATALLGGCRSPAATEASPTAHVTVPEQRAVDMPPPISPQNSQVVQAAHLEEVLAEVIAAPPPPEQSTAVPLRLDLFQAMETSLLQNPDLTALRRNEGVSVAALGVAQTYPFNPFIQVQATPYQDNKIEGPGTVYHYVLLMQQIQLGHQQRFREESALAALSSVRWNIVQAELLNVAQTERLYFTALYLRGVRDLVYANAVLNDQLLGVIAKRVEAGDAAAADEAIARLDNRTTRQQAALADANYQTALLDLKRHLNLPMTSPLEPVGELSDLDWLVPWPEHAASNDLDSPVWCPQGVQTATVDLTASRPDVMAARAELAAARANTEVARGSRIPDLQIGPYYQRTESGTTYLGFRAQTDIPVINTGVPLVRQREAETRQRFAVWQQLQTRAHLEAEAAVDRYVRARNSAYATADESGLTLPGELEKLEQQFRAGDIDFLRIVTARTSLIAARRAQLDMLNETAQAAAALTAATGLPPESILRIKADATP